jgi:hypothetical protein
MTLGEIIDVSQIPYLSKADLAGRFLCTLSFYDAGAWHTWVPTEGPRQKVIEIQAWPAEAFYFGKTPESPNDIFSGFLTFIAQRANLKGFHPPFSAIQDDIFNLSASLAKLNLIFAAADTVTSGATRLAATEVEYILLVCRSVFDLLQEMLAKLWGAIAPTDPAKKKRALKKTFSDMTLSDNKLRSVTQIAEQYALPVIIAECYARHAPMFLKIRQFRDSLVHRGHQVQTIFRGEKGFVIQKRLGPFLNLDIWHDDEVQENDLVPLLPALAMVVHGTLAACEDFANTLMSCIRFADPIVPGMNLYMRGYFNEALLAALADADGRLAEGRRLVGDQAAG